MKKVVIYQALGLEITSSKKGETNLRVCLDLKPSTAKVALAPERKYGRRVVHADLLLLGIVANSHAYVGIASSAVGQRYGESWISGLTARSMYIPPDVEWKLKTSDENTLVNFPSSISQRMFACI